MATRPLNNIEGSSPMGGTSTKQRDISNGLKSQYISEPELGAMLLASSVITVYIIKLVPMS